MTTGVFAVVALIVYGVGVPLCVSVVLVRSRHRLEDPEFKKVFGFLYDGFQLDSSLAVSWDSIILLRRLLITTVTILFSTDAYLQALGASLVTMAFIIAHVHVKPFADPLHNVCEFVGLIAVLLTQMGSLLYFYASNKQDHAWWDDSVAIGTTLLLLVTNIGTVMFLAFVGAWYARVKLIQVAGKVWFKLSSKLKLVKGGGEEKAPGAATAPEVVVEMKASRRDTINPMVNSMVKENALFR